MNQGTFLQSARRLLAGIAVNLILASSAHAAPVIWANWTSATSGAAGQAAGTLTTPNGTVSVSYAGEVAFAQTDEGGTNYFIPTTPYVSSTVDNAPASTDIIALSTNTPKTLTFSQPIDNLFFAVVSLNGNGYQFNQDFEIVSTGAGYWGNGTLAKVVLPDNGGYQLIGTGEPHGVIRFIGAVSSITWTSLSNEFWNGFTIGTYGVIDTGNPYWTFFPEDVTVPATSAGGAVVDYQPPVAHDDFDDSDINVNCLPEPGSLFPVGTTTVTCTALDTAENSISGTLLVTVTDTSAGGRLPEVAFARATLRAGPGGVTTILVKISKAYRGPIKVPFSIGGNADPGHYQLSAQGSVTIPAYARSALIRLNLNGSPPRPRAETLVLTLGTPTGGAVLGSPSQLSITLLPTKR